MDLASPVMAHTYARLLGRFGGSVGGWWSRLPGLVEELAVRWDLVIGDPVGRGGTSLVLRCRTADGRAAMLKLTPDAAIARDEARALRAWTASGRVPGVWASDGAAGALLLEAIADELPLASTPGPVDLGEIVGLLDALGGCVADLDGLPALGERVDFLFAHWIELHALDPVVAKAVPPARLLRAGDLARELARDGGATPVLVHGDLHAGNVLHGKPGRGLIAIDPRACVGEAEFDAADWVYWRVAPDGWSERCRELAAALDLDRERLWAWAAALAPLNAAAIAARGGPSSEVAALLSTAP